MKKTKTEKKYTETEILGGIKTTKEYKNEDIYSLLENLDNLEYWGLNYFGFIQIYYSDETQEILESKECAEFFYEIGEILTNYEDCECSIKEFEQMNVRFRELLKIIIHKIKENPSLYNETYEYII